MKWLGVLSVLFAAVVLADETYAPATPIPPSGDTIASYQVTELRILSGFGGATAEIDIVVQPATNSGGCVRDWNGSCRTIRAVYTAGDATALLNILNTANLTNNSLRKRVLTKLVTDGYLPAGGTTSGTPGVVVLPTPVPTITP